MKSKEVLRMSLRCDSLKVRNDIAKRSKTGQDVSKVIHEELDNLPGTSLNAARWNEKQKVKSLIQRRLGFGGGLGFGTPVVSYAPLPMLQVVDSLIVSIMLTDCARAESQQLFQCLQPQGFQSMTCFEKQRSHVRFDLQCPNLEVKLNKDDGLPTNTNVRYVWAVWPSRGCPECKQGVDFNICCCVMFCPLTMVVQDGFRSVWQYWYWLNCYVDHSTPRLGVRALNGLWYGRWMEQDQSKCRRRRGNEMPSEMFWQIEWCCELRLSLLVCLIDVCSIVQSRDVLVQLEIVNL